MSGRNATQGIGSRNSRSIGSSQEAEKKEQVFSSSLAGSFSCLLWVERSLDLDSKAEIRFINSSPTTTGAGLELRGSSLITGMLELFLRILRKIFQLSYFISIFLHLLFASHRIFKKFYFSIMVYIQYYFV